MFSFFQIEGTDYVVAFVFFSSEVKVKFIVEDFSDINFLFHKFHLSLDKDELTKYICKTNDYVETLGLFMDVFFIYYIFLRHTKAIFGLLKNQRDVREDVREVELLEENIICTSIE